MDRIPKSAFLKDSQWPALSRLWVSVCVAILFPPGYITLRYFPFNVGDAGKYGSVNGTVPSIHLSEADTVSLTSSSFLIRHRNLDPGLS